MSHITVSDIQEFLAFHSKGLTLGSRDRFAIQRDIRCVVPAAGESDITRRGKDQLHDAVRNIGAPDNFPNIQFALFRIELAIRCDFRFDRVVFRHLITLRTGQAADGDCRCASGFADADIHAAGKGAIRLRRIGAAHAAYIDHQLRIRQSSALILYAYIQRIRRAVAVHEGIAFAQHGADIEFAAVGTDDFAIQCDLRVSDGTIGDGVAPASCDQAADCGPGAGTALGVLIADGHRDSRFIHRNICQLTADIETGDSGRVGSSVAIRYDRNSGFVDNQIMDICLGDGPEQRGFAAGVGTVIPPDSTFCPEDGCINVEVADRQAG